MGQNKLKKFEDMRSFEMVFEPSKETMTGGDFFLKGKWSENFFRNNNPIVLELGCGKGEYTIAQARKNPNINFIGVDIKGARMWRGATTAHQEELKNVAFLRTRIEFINNFFAVNEVSAIWLTFSDPQLKDKKGTKRLTHPIFLKRYHGILQQEGIIHLKTDSTFLFSYTRGVIDGLGCKLLYTTHNLYGADWVNLGEEERELLGIKTFYEKMFLDEEIPIKYLRFKLNGIWN